MEELTMREMLTGHMNPTHRGTNMKQIPEYPHVHFIDLDHYNKALALAEKLGGEALESLKRSFTTLDRICKNSKLTAEVHPDGVENSFYFITYHKNKADMNGGIILHGMGKSFSVEFPGRTGIHWSMHT